MAVMKSRDSKNLNGQRMTIPYFNPKAGSSYHILFTPFSDDPTAAVVLAERVHTVQNGKDRVESVRCLYGHYKYVEEGSDVLELDPTTNHPKNDGTCPYCKYWDSLSRNLFGPAFERWKEENPGASDEDSKTKWGEISKKSPVTKAKIVRYYPAAVIEVDSNGGALHKNQNGTPKYEILLVRTTDSQFENKLDSAADSFRKIEIQTNETQTDGIAGREFVFKYPDVQDRMQMALRMTIAQAPYPILGAYAEEIFEVIYEIDLEKVDSEISSFVPRSIDSALMSLQPHQTKMKELFLQFGADLSLMETGDIPSVTSAEVDDMLGLGSGEGTSSEEAFGTEEGSATTVNHQTTLTPDEIENLI